MKYIALIGCFLLVGLGWFFFQESSLPNRATIETNFGTFTIHLHKKQAPVAVRNFRDLAQQGAYNETLFHRTIPGFVIQGGDWTHQDGTGGQSARGGAFADEISDKAMLRGSVAMANKGPDTNTSQFFILLRDAPELQGKHTIFGSLTNGIEIVETLSQLPTDTFDRPLQEAIILSITFD